MLVALTGITNAQMSEISSRSRAPSSNHLRKNATANVWAMSSQRSSIVVRIDPRLPSGGSGSAIVELRNGAGELLMAAVASFNGLGKGVNGPRRDVRYGDTPFGVYKYVRPAGGTAESRISPAFGTGKLYLDDNDMFGEVSDAGRGTIRLHGGGSSLPDPYVLEQPLLATQGCVRMRNRDINALIQLIKALPQEETLEFVFMGSNAYLRKLATDTTLSDKSWWSVLRRDLQLPPSPPIGFMLASWKVQSPGRVELVRSVTAVQVDAQLIELIRTFAEDAGPIGRSAFDQLRARADSLLQLQNSLPRDDALRPMIAFTLCYAGRDCGANLAVIELAFNKPSPFKGFYADEAQEMLNRLIEKANQEGRQDDVKNLILKLLVTAPAADGALAEGLGVTLSLKLRDQTSSFLAALDELAATAESTAVTNSALELIRSADYLTSNELTNITTQVRGNPSASATIKQTFTEFGQLYRQTHQTDRPINQLDQPNNQRDRINQPARPNIQRDRPINQPDRIRP
jgi:hypothetical protein